MHYLTHVVVAILLYRCETVAFKQRTEAEDTKADPAAADSWRYEADR